MNVLITGAGSYVGEYVAAYLKNEHNVSVYCLDVETDQWKLHDFSQYDVVYHVAGLAHRKITKDIEALYFKVNRDLAVAIAEKSKDAGIRHFIFMSSMSVYSDDTTYITSCTPTKPDNVYGKSKLQAEEQLLKMNADNFIVSVIRPPMIYGKGCKGNYNSLRKIALTFPIFPKVHNKRSMLYIENMAEFVYQLIKTRREGVFYPQNAELVNTSDWAKHIADANGHKLFLSRLLGVGVSVGKHMPKIKDICQKAFGDSYYDTSMSNYDDMPYNVIGFKESIEKTER